MQASDGIVNAEGTKNSEEGALVVDKQVPYSPIAKAGSLSGWSCVTIQASVYVLLRSIVIASLISLISAVERFSRLHQA